MNIGLQNDFTEFMQGFVAALNDVISRVGNISIIGIPLYVWLTVGAIISVIAYFIHDRG